MGLVSIKKYSIPKRAIIGYDLEQSSQSAGSHDLSSAGAVKATKTDGSSDFLDAKIQVSGGITKTVSTDENGVQKIVLASDAAGLPSLKDKNILSNDGTSPIWSEDIQLNSTNTAFNKSLSLNSTGDGSTADNCTIFMPNNATIGGNKGLKIKNDLDIAINSGGYSSLKGSKGASLVADDGSNSSSVNVTNMSIELNSEKVSLPKLEYGYGSYIIADANGTLFRANGTLGHTIRVQTRITRADLLSLYTTPLRLIGSDPSNLIIPHRFIIKQGATRYYSGTIYATYGNTYNANNTFAWFNLAGGLPTAKYTNCLATATGVVNEGLPIYITTNSPITDSGTSSTINVWLDYSVLNCVMI